MRPLTEAEMTQVFGKLHRFVGRDIEKLVERADGRWCFRLHRKKVFHVREDLMKRAANVARESLVGLGVQVGKFTHSGKFQLTITSLGLLAQHAKFKVWVKPSAEMSFLYGNHVLKSGLARITESTPLNAGVVVYSMSDIPLGFGVAAKTTEDCRKLDPHGIVAFHQGDCGEYLRSEEDL